MCAVIISALLTLVPVLTAQDAARAQPRDAEARAWELLDKSLSSGSFQKRQALAALAMLGEPDEHAVNMAEAALHDKDPLVRQSAALTLGEL
jgi:hypothetical protein